MYEQEKIRPKLKTNIKSKEKPKFKANINYRPRFKANIVPTKSDPTSITQTQTKPKTQTPPPKKMFKANIVATKPKLDPIPDPIPTPVVAQPKLDPIPDPIPTPVVAQPKPPLPRMLSLEATQSRVLRSITIRAANLSPPQTPITTDTLFSSEEMAAAGFIPQVLSLSLEHDFITLQPNNHYSLSQTLIDSLERKEQHEKDIQKIV